MRSERTLFLLARRPQRELLKEGAATRLLPPSAFRPARPPFTAAVGREEHHFSFSSSFFLSLLPLLDRRLRMLAHPSFSDLTTCLLRSVAVASVRVLCPSDLVLFFEFKHYKPSKKKISTRCFALMEAKEMMKAKDQPGVCLELSVRRGDGESWGDWRRCAAATTIPWDDQRWWAPSLVRVLTALTPH